MVFRMRNTTRSREVQKRNYDFSKDVYRKRKHERGGKMGGYGQSIDIL